MCVINMSVEVQCDSYLQSERLGQRNGGRGGMKSNFTAKDKYSEEGGTDGYTLAEEGRGGEIWEQNNSIIEQRSSFSRTAAGRAALSQI